MCFVMRYALTSAALVGLLQLVNELFGRPVLNASKYLFRKIFHNELLKFSFHFYCLQCYSLVCTYDKVRPGSVPCPHCETPCVVQNLSRSNFFVTTDLKAQVRSLFETPQVAQNLNYRNTRNKQNIDNIEDIFDGEIYKKLCAPGQPLDNAHNFSYSFNSDGMPVFKSSKFSLWPIYLMINELPPKLRKDNLILAGVWFGKTEPKMNIFLQQFVSEAQKLATQGVNWKNGEDLVNSKLYGISCNVDAPARAAMQNTVQFNGYMGCGLCYHPGVSIERTIKYPFNVGDYNDRSDDEMLLDMEQALEEGRIVRGVKGPSPLINLPYFSPVWGFPVDFMHCVLLGVTRQLTDLWFDPPATNPFYIGSPNNVYHIDCLLENANFPAYFTRTQRPLSERKFWKATEWYSWLLFLCLPCLWSVLPNIYFSHFCILVEAVFLLLQKSATKADVNKADALLYSFVAKMQILYGESAMTFNIHSLTHLAQSVQNWGPLWTHSCFPFEAANGKIKALLHGNRGIISQTLYNFLVLKCLPAFKLAYTISPEIQSVCDNMLFSRERLPARILGGVKLYGEGQVVQLSLQELQAIEILGLGAVENDVVVFNRMVVKGLTYHTVSYSKSRKRNNRILATTEGRIGELQKIVCIGPHECIALVKEMGIIAANEFSDNESGCEVSHIKICTGYSGRLFATFALNIAHSCIFLTVGNRSYVGIAPNYVSI